MDFISFDFETSGGKLQYPCSIGITVVENDLVKSSYNFLINPETKIAPYSTKIHGITNEMVKSEPTFPDVYEKINPFFECYGIAVAHNAAFDQSVLQNSCERYNLQMPRCIYYCTLEHSMKYYSSLPKHSLDYLCGAFGIELTGHHDSGSDSRATAELLLKMLDGAPYNSEYKTEPKKSESFFNAVETIYQTPNMQFDELDEIMFDSCRFVITGDVPGYSRSDLKSEIESKGGKVTGSVSSKTDYLIVGDENLNVVNDKENAKSGKIIAAEKIRTDGGKIKILSFKCLIKCLKGES